MKTLFSFCLSIITFGANAQAFTVAADKMNVAYIGIDNPLTIVADNTTCKELLVTTDNGKIEKTNSCHFLYRPVKEGRTIIKVQKKSGGKLTTIAQQDFRAKSIPDPHVMVMNKRSGYVPLNQFKLQIGLAVGFDEEFVLDMKFSVVSFRVTMIDGVRTLFSEDISGNRFSPNTIIALNKLIIGNRVLFDNIKMKGPDNLIRPMNSMLFTMR